MKHNFLLISDYFFSETLGGAELNAESLVDRFLEHGYFIPKVRSADVTIKFLEENKDKVYIFSNFVKLRKECRQYAIKNLAYFVYEQDHKYLKNRNPIGYKDFLAPKNQITNVDFYKAAIKVLFLTRLSMDIFAKNTGLDNLLNLSSSVWRQGELKFIKKICNNPKTKDVAILQSKNPIKRTRDCIDYCTSKGLQYELIKDSNFKNFLFKMSKFERLLFLTGHVETCARIVVEAKMLNLKTIIQKKVIGAASEDWFSLSGEPLIDEMEKISHNMPLKIIEALHNKENKE